MWCAHFVLHNILIIIEKIIVRVVCAGVVPGVLWCGMWDSKKHFRPSVVTDLCPIIIHLQSSLIPLATLHGQRNPQLPTQGCTQHDVVTILPIDHSLFQHSWFFFESF